MAHTGLTGGALEGATVGAIVDGDTYLGSASTGANGYYYMLLPQGSLAAGDTVVTYLSGGSVRADSAADDIAGGAALTGLNLYGGALTVHHPGCQPARPSRAGLAAGLGSATTAAGADIIFSTPGGALTLTSGDSLYLVSTGPAFAFDQNLGLGTGTLKINAAGQVSQTSGAITAAAVLEGTSDGGLGLTDSGNAIAALTGWSDAAGSIALTDARALLVNGTVKADDGIDLTTTAGGLNLSRGLSTTSGDVTLDSAGTVVESAALATITDAAGVLERRHPWGGAKLQTSNKVGSLTLANTGGGTAAFSEAGVLHVTSASNAAGGALTLTTTSGDLGINGAVSGGKVTLISAGRIAESGAGAITATTLTGSAGGAVTLGGANHIATLASFTDTAGSFGLDNSQALAVTGTLNAGTFDVSLTTLAGNIAVNGTIAASTLSLNAQTGTLTESGSLGAIKVSTLNATADTGITLTSANNAIGAIGTNHTNSGPDKITQ